ncbi:protein-lysine 6-oxidase-like [Cynoglossus semilaevis]|uniref:protein-lysine 6-oxidase-like n=1 Tax=Cynoglossus semilaevis TaxID=244447 RepID=UPI000497EF49|nr:protein-lysine 6-oxidase-like [Cynoglossus semilaevis]
MAKWSVSLLYFFQGLLSLSSGQQQQQQQQQHPQRTHVGPWRHRIQWQNHGQVYSLMSTGSEFHAPVRSRSHSRVYVSSRRDGTRSRPAEGHRVTDLNVPPGILTPGRDGRPFVSVGSQGTREQPERTSVSDFPTALETEAEGFSPFHLQTEDGPGEVTTPGENMVNDDPRNPFKNHRNSVFYNLHPSTGRSVARPHRPPGAGYGTRYFQNGLPDLVPDPYAIQAGAYVQRMQMYALRCAAEENCLARSAYGPAVRDIDFRVLLRFPQKVKNQGTSDFLPVKPRYQWDWHSCHQHYHSMDAFSNYDLLDMRTGRKVAEGHKASFCLEDTGCDAGFRRRYACTSHTQGLSPGCHDLYAANIDCQWIDITDVPPGNYILRVMVNPNFHVLESDFTNNVVRCDITYTGVFVQTRNCRISRG